MVGSFVALALVGSLPSVDVSLEVDRRVYLSDLLAWWDFARARRQGL
jgi:hypothetical protein